jgi:vitamin B12 transporter
VRKLLAPMATIFVTHLAAAQPAVTLPDTVITATRTPLPVEDIPAGVTVIDRQQIEASGAVTLGDVLDTVPGLHVSASGGPGGQASVFMRGTNSDHVLVLRDGMPINDASDVSGAYNFGTETLSDVERIEIIRGPMAALYGSGAIGGVINLISRRGAAGPPRVEMDLAGGYPAAIVGAASASGAAGPMDYALTLESQSRRGFDSTPQRQTSIYTGTPQGFRDRIATLNLGYTPVKGTRLSLFLRADRAVFGFDTLGYPTFDDSNSSGTTTSMLGRIGGTTHLFHGLWKSEVFLGRAQDDRRYFEALNLADPNLTAQDNRYHAYRTDLQWNNTVHLNELFPSAVLSHSDLTFGYEHTVDTINVKINDSFGGFPYTSVARASMTTDAGYVGMTTSVMNRVVLTGQVRQDSVGPNAPTTWRLGSVIRVPEIDTSFKAAYGTAFRAPSLFERFGVDSYGTVGNPDLKPESAKGWEVGFTTDLKLPADHGTATLGVTYFDQQVTNLITNVYGPVTTWANLGSARIQGVETAFTLRPAPWLTLHASYTFTDAVSADQGAAIGTELLRRPRNAGAVDAVILPWSGVRIRPELIYTGTAHDYLYDDNGLGIGYGVGQHGLVANLSASYDLSPKVRLYLDGRNIFNSRFEPVNGYQMPGASAMAGIRLRI